MTPWTRTVIVLVCLALVAGQGRADEETSFENVVLARARAQARFEASQATTEQLARQRKEAAEQAYFAAQQEFRAGRGTLDYLLELKHNYSRASSPLPATVATPRPVLEDLWLFSWTAYTLNEARYEASRISAVDYYRSLYQLRDAEIQLALTRAKKKK